MTKGITCGKCGEELEAEAEKIKEHSCSAWRIMLHGEGFTLGAVFYLLFGAKFLWTLDPRWYIDIILWLVLWFGFFAFDKSLKRFLR